MNRLRLAMYATLVPLILGLTPKDRLLIVQDYLRAVSGPIAAAPILENPDYFDFDSVVLGSDACGSYQTSEHKQMRGKVILPSPLPCVGELSAYGITSSGHDQVFLGKIDYRDPAAELIRSFTRVDPSPAVDELHWFATRLRSSLPGTKDIYGVFLVNHHGSVLGRYFVTDPDIVGLTLQDTGEKINLSTTRNGPDNHEFVHMILKKDGSPPIRVHLDNGDQNAMLRSSLVTDDDAYYLVEKPLKISPILAPLVGPLEAAEITLFHRSIHSSTKSTKHKVLTMRAKIFQTFQIFRTDQQSVNLKIRGDSRTRCFRLMPNKASEETCSSMTDEPNPIIRDHHGPYLRLSENHGAQP